MKNVEITAKFIVDVLGNFTDPETGECWNVPEDRQAFRDTIRGKTIICGRKTFEKDWRGLKGADNIIVLTSEGQRFYENHMHEAPFTVGGISACGAISPTEVIGTIYMLDAIAHTERERQALRNIYCVGGEETLRSMLPFITGIDARIIFHGHGTMIVMPLNIILPAWEIEDDNFSEIAPNLRRLHLKRTI